MNFVELGIIYVNSLWNTIIELIIPLFIKRIDELGFLSIMLLLGFFK